MDLSSEEIAEYPRTAKGHCELMEEAHRRLGGMEPVEAFLIKHGQEFEANPTPDWVPQMTPKMCFANCFELVCGNPDRKLAYCEGYVLSSGLPIPIHHAWCVEDDETLIEPTLPDRTEEEQVTYFGVKVPNFRDLCDVVVATQTYSILFKRVGHEMIEEISAKTSSSNGNGQA